MRGLILLCLAVVLGFVIASAVAEEANLLSQLRTLENDVEENADTLFFRELFDRIFKRKQQAKPEIRKQIVPTTNNTTSSVTPVSKVAPPTPQQQKVSQAKPQKKTFYQRLPKFARQAIDRLTKFKEALKNAKATKEQKKQAKKALNQQTSKNFVKAVAKNNNVSKKEAKKLIKKAATKAQKHESVKKLEQLRKKIRELKKKNKALKNQNQKKDDGAIKKTPTADKIVENLKKGKLAFGVKLNRKQLGSLKGKQGVTEFYAKVRMLLKKREGMLKKAEKDASVAAIPKPLVKAVNIVHKFMATLTRFKKSKKTKKEKKLVSKLIKQLRKADRHILMNMPCCDRKLEKVFRRAKELGSKIDPSVQRVLVKLETKVKAIRSQVATVEKQHASKGNGYHLVVRLNEMSKQKQKIQKTCTRVQKDAKKVVKAVKELKSQLPKKHRKVAKKLIRRLNKLTKAAQKPVNKIDELWHTTFGKIESSFASFRAGLVGALKDLRKTAKQIRSEKRANKK